jgi:transcriptional regulator with XRE-family HTH domain
MPDTLSLHVEKFLLALGSLLRDARISAKKTQEQLALEAQVHRSYISMIERGLADPRIDITIRMADALGVRPLSIFRQAELQATEVAGRAARRPASAPSRTAKTGSPAR